MLFYSNMFSYQSSAISHEQRLHKWGDSLKARIKAMDELESKLAERDLKLKER